MYSRGHTEIVRLLLQQPNIDIQKKNKWGDTPESIASLNGYIELVNLLQQYVAKKSFTKSFNEEN